LPQLVQRRTDHIARSLGPGIGGEDVNRLYDPCPDHRRRLILSVEAVMHSRLGECESLIIVLLDQALRDPLNARIVVHDVHLRSTGGVQNPFYKCEHPEAAEIFRLRRRRIAIDAPDAAAIAAERHGEARRPPLPDQRDETPAKAGGVAVELG